MSLPVSQTFAGTDGTSLHSLNASWNQIAGLAQIKSNGATWNSGTFGIVAWDGDTLSNDQQVSCTMQALAAGSGSRMGPAVRCNDAANTAYVLDVGLASNILGLALLQAGAYSTLIANAGTAHVGDIVTLRVRGINLQVLINGIVTGSVTDSTLTSGRAGMFGVGTGLATQVSLFTANNFAPLFVTGKVVNSFGNAAIADGSTLSQVDAKWNQVAGATLTSSRLPAWNSATAGVVVWDGDTFNPDQQSMCFMSNFLVNDGTSSFGPAVRCSDTANTGYVLQVGMSGVNGQNIQLSKLIAGSLTTLIAVGSFTGFALVGPFDAITLQVQGTTLTVLLNGVVAGTATDLSLSSGRPGMFGSGTGQGTRMLTWSADDVPGTIFGAFATLGMDTFGRANGGLGSSWTPIDGTKTIQIIGNNFTSSQASDQYEVSKFNTTAFGPDQFSQATFNNLGGGGNTSADIAVVVRGSGVQGSTAYYILFAETGASLLELWKVAGVTQTEFSITPRAWVAGDTIRLEVRGNRLIGYINGFPYIAFIDSGIAAGAPGIGVYSAPGLDTTVGGNNWSGGAVGLAVISGAVAPNTVTGSKVTLTLSGAAFTSTIDASDGTYSFSGLSPGNYIVTPSGLAGYTFTPVSANITISVVGQAVVANFIASNFASSPVPGPQALTLGQLRSDIRNYLMNTNSADPSSFSWSDSELNDYINDGIFYTQQITQYFVDSINLPVVVGQQDYEMPAQSYQVYRETFDRDFIPQVNEYELDRDKPFWRTEPNNTPIRWFLSNWHTASLYPKPIKAGITYPCVPEIGVLVQVTLADGITQDTNFVVVADGISTSNKELGTIVQWIDTDPGPIVCMQSDDLVMGPAQISPDLGALIWYSTDEANIAVYFFRQPDLLVLDTDSPQLPMHCHYGLVFYALMRCFAREGEFQDQDLANGFFQAYGDWMESVLELKGREWPTRVHAFEPDQPDSLFMKRLQSIGPPSQLDFNASYGGGN